MKKYILFIAVFVFALQSCEKEFDPGGTLVEKMAGDWYCELQFEDDGEWINLLSLYGYDYFKMTTYNTAANNNEMFIDDGDELWPFKGKVTCDVANMTFNTGGKQVENLYDEDIPFEVMNGKVLLGAAHSVAGHVTDSIYLEIEFDDDPGEIYRIVGHRRTGFTDDDDFEHW